MPCINNVNQVAIGSIRVTSCRRFSAFTSANTRAAENEFFRSWLLPGLSPLRRWQNAQSQKQLPRRQSFFLRVFSALFVRACKVCLSRSDFRIVVYAKPEGEKTHFLIHLDHYRFAGSNGTKNAPSSKSFDFNMRVSTTGPQIEQNTHTCTHTHSHA